MAIQVYFYFKNRSSLLQIVQALLFIPQLHLLPQPRIHSAVTSVTPTPQYKDDANHKHLKNQRTEQLSAELKLLECFNREELNVMKKRIEDLRSQKVIPNHSVVTKSLKEEL